MQTSKTPVNASVNVAYKAKNLFNLLCDLNETSLAPFEVLIWLERNVNYLRRTVFPKDFPEKYMPYCSTPFLAKTLNINLEYCDYHNKLPLVLHPHFISTTKHSWDSEVLVLPSSSTRTFFQIDLKVFVKTHLPIHIGPFRRSLDLSSVHHGVSISNFLASLTNIPLSFAFLPEFNGVSTNMNNSEVACVYRKAEAYPKIRKKSFLIPMFSLYSPLEGESIWGSLLIDLLNNNSNPGESVLNTFYRVLVRPYLATWIYFVQHYGVIFEPHGQNTLIEIDYSGKIIRFVYRDFQGIRIIASKFPRNFNISRHLLTSENKISDSLSLVYDTYICDYLFRHFVRILAQYCAVEESLIKENIKSIFSELSGDIKHLFSSEKVCPILNNAKQAKFEGSAILEHLGSPEYR